MPSYTTNTPLTPSQVNSNASMQSRSSFSNKNNAVSRNNISQNNNPSQFNGNTFSLTQYSVGNTASSGRKASGSLDMPSSFNPYSASAKLSSSSSNNYNGYKTASSTASTTLSNNTSRSASRGKSLSSKHSFGR